MRRGVTSFEGSSGEFAWLLLRVIAQLCPCSTNALVAHVSGDTAPGESGRSSHTRRLVLDALLTLEILDLIDSSEEQIVLTDKGRRDLHESAVPASETSKLPICRSPPAPSALPGLLRCVQSSCAARSAHEWYSSRTSITHFNANLEVQRRSDDLVPSDDLGRSGDRVLEFGVQTGGRLGHPARKLAKAIRSSAKRTGREQHLSPKCTLLWP